MQTQINSLHSWHSSTLITIEGDNGSKGYFQTLNPDFVPNEIRHLPENERQKIKQESKVYKLEGKSTKEFEVPKEYRLLCGLAIGYPSDARINTFKSHRISVDEMIIEPKK